MSEEQAVAQEATPEVASVSEEESVAEQVESSESEETAEETTQTDEADGDATDEESDEQPDDAEGEEGESKRPQKTANERVREALEKAKQAEEKALKVERDFAEKLEEEKALKKPFVEVDMAKVNSKLQEMMDEVDALKIDGKTYDAIKKQREIDEIINKVEENDKARQEWEEKQQEGVQTKQRQEEILGSLDKAALTFRESQNIPEALFSQQGEFFKQAIESDPVLAGEFQELIEAGRYMTAVKFAHDHVVNKMGSAATAEKEKRETAKAASVGKGESIDAQEAANKKIKELRKQVFGTGKAPKADDVAEFLAQRRQLRSK